VGETPAIPVRNRTLPSAAAAPAAAPTLPFTAAVAAGAAASSQPTTAAGPAAAGAPPSARPAKPLDGTLTGILAHIASNDPRQRSVVCVVCKRGSRYGAERW